MSKVEHIQLDQGKIARDCIIQTFLPSGLHRGRNNFLTTAKIDRFFKQMQKKQTSEAGFFLVKTIPYQELPNTVTTISRTIYSQTGINVFNQFQLREATYEMIPSFSMMQEFLRVHSGARQSVRITPVIGDSSVQDIVKCGKTHTRVMRLPFPDSPFPKKADCIDTPYFMDYIRHEFYHAIVASDVPKKYQLAFIELAETLLTVSAGIQNSLIHDFLNEFYERLIDMEHPGFRKTNPAQIPGLLNPDLRQKFLWSITNQFFNTFRRLQTKLESDPRKSSMSGEFYIEEILNQLINEKVFNRIAKALHKNRFCQKLGITTYDLALMAAINRSKIFKSELNLSQQLYNEFYKL